MVAIIKESDKKVLKLIGTHIADALNRNIKRIAKDSKKFTQDFIERGFIQSEEFRLLITDDRIKGELGLTNVESKLLSIFKAIVNNIEVKTKPFRMGNTLHGSIEIRILRTDHSDITKIGSAFQFVKSGDNSYLLPWLQWLLFEGNNTVVSNYEFLPKSGLGRNKLGIMRSSKGFQWNVPTDIQGVEEDNFLTRALDSIMENYENNLLKEIEAMFRDIFDG